MAKKITSHQDLAGCENSKLYIVGNEIDHMARSEYREHIYGGALGFGMFDFAQQEGKRPAYLARCCRWRSARRNLAKGGGALFGAARGGLMFVAGAGFGGGRKGNSLWIWVRSLLLEAGDATTQGSKVVLLLNPLFYFVCRL